MTNSLPSELLRHRSGWTPPTRLRVPRANVDRAISTVVRYGSPGLARLLNRRRDRWAATSQRTGPTGSARTHAEASLVEDRKRRRWIGAGNACSLASPRLRRTRVCTRRIRCQSCLVHRALQILHVVRRRHAGLRSRPAACTARPWQWAPNGMGASSGSPMDGGSRSSVELWVSRWHQPLVDRWRSTNPSAARMAFGRSPGFQLDRHRSVKLAQRDSRIVAAPFGSGLIENNVAPVAGQTEPAAGGAATNGRILKANCLSAAS